MIKQPRHNLPGLHCLQEMDISQNSDYVLSHPYLREAVDNFRNGDVNTLKFIFVSLQEDMYHKMLVACNKSFKRFKHENFPIIEEEIKLTPSPDCLSIKLPIPLPKEACKIVPMKVKQGRTIRPRFIDAMQLEIDFTKKGETFIEEKIAL